jgi:hypothetical protein
LWLRRSRVRAPSVTLVNYLLIADKGKALGERTGVFDDNASKVMCHRMDRR